VNGEWTVLDRVAADRQELLKRVFLAIHICHRRIGPTHARFHSLGTEM
jgi:hypothetical protein